MKFGPGEIVVPVIGGSGSGKDTLVNELIRRHPDWMKVKSKTTRQCRGKADKENHIFTDVSEYWKDLQANQIIASTEYDKNYYWATYDQLSEERPVIFYIVDVVGLNALRERYRDKTLVSIGLMIAPEIAEERMIARGDSKEAIRRRLENGDYYSFENADVGIDASASIKEVADKAEQIIATYSWLSR